MNIDILSEADYNQQFKARYEGWRTFRPAFPTVLEWWDDVKSRIKQFTVEYCVARARRRREEFLSLCSRERNWDSSALHAIQQYLDQKLHGARVRARVHCVEAEEKPTIKFYRDVTNESLARAFQVEPLFRPFYIPGGAEVRCLQYADDVTCVVSDLASFRALTGTLSTFQRATGARLNPTKTKGLRLGKWRSKQLPFAASWIDDAIKINGVWFGYG
ncbi:hypothetical protein HOLleu_10579 [Holothuria leucospilota]|uniref:Reverse transcriptase domain-containing protein n=1 Tax=Holothuria leucospilota TaxID=206669 RepID=A0A9Q1CEI2_HOLLE|nr:hypothetical protein HOLleu_10579 [Holothuria leucospilota]